MKPASLLQMSGVIVDLLFWVKDVPAAGEEAEVLDFALSSGGGFNAMVAARRAGMEVCYGGSLGCGPFSDCVERDLRRACIERLRQRSEQADQGCCTVLIDRNGERSFVAKEGADGQATTAELSAINVADFDWCLLSGYMLTYRHCRDAYAEWLRMLPIGTSLVFDPSPLVASIEPAMMDLALEKALWVSANLDEATRITGARDPLTAAQILASGKPDHGGAVVRYGEKGCVIALGNRQAQQIPAYPVRAIDTNGAGDTHIGCFIAALSHGLQPADATRYANVAAALSTTEKGPSTAPLHHQTNAILQSLSVEA